jgi:superoxide dismutase, Cu-Zn family
MMRALISLWILPLCVSCAPIQTAKTVAVSEVSLANLATADGKPVGVATLSQRSDGLWLEVSATIPAAGTYGMHIHGVGKCDGPDFASAGPHFNPGNMQHGQYNMAGPHAGDLPNLVAGTDGKASAQTRLPDMPLTGAGGLIDADGSALVIHAQADDYKTDPSGNSGKRVMCGVFSVK